MTLHEFNQLSQEDAAAELFKCCGSSNWVKLLMEQFPFASEQVLFDAAREVWYTQCEAADYREAFSHHPKIGDVDSLKKKFASTSDWAGNEQAGVNSADETTIQDLADFNAQYLQKNGYIFIVCASGKSAGELLQILQARIGHSADEELGIAMGEQFKITLIRLNKLIDLENPVWTSGSHITTHVLDTSIGVPGQNICIRLKHAVDGQWQTMALGISNADGRIGDLLPAGLHLAAGHYQMCFDTGAYFKAQNKKGFYPQVVIDFTTFDQSHYHVPLLINPFGYSTYRGS